MRKALPLIAITFALASLAHADNLRSTIKTFNRKVHATFVKNDMNAFEKVARATCTSDFKEVENGQSHDFDAMLAQMKQGFAMMKINSASATTSKLMQHGDSATCQSNHHMTGSLAGPDKKKHKMVFDGVSTDTWRKEDGHWKLASMVWGKETIKMDGKKIDPSQMMGGSK